MKPQKTSSADSARKHISVLYKQVSLLKEHNAQLEARIAALEGRAPAPARIDASAISISEMAKRQDLPSGKVYDFMKGRYIEKHEDGSLLPREEFRGRGYFVIRRKKGHVSQRQTFVTSTAVPILVEEFKKWADL